jgi:hypothetical protein
MAQGKTSPRKQHHKRTHKERKLVIYMCVLSTQMEEALSLNL